MRVAYEEFYLGKFQEPQSWISAQLHHQYLLKIPEDQATDLQFQTSSDSANVISPTKIADFFGDSSTES